MEDRILPEITIRKFAIDIISGLLYLHKNGIIFRDLKPSNIIMNENGLLKLSDFCYALKVSNISENNKDSDI